MTFICLLIRKSASAAAENVVTNVAMCGMELYSPFYWRNKKSDCSIFYLFWEIFNKYTKCDKYIHREWKIFEDYKKIEEKVTSLIGSLRISSMNWGNIFWAMLYPRPLHTETMLMTQIFLEVKIPFHGIFQIVST